MITPEWLLALMDRLRTEWALEGVRNPNRDWTPDFAYGVVHGRDQALQLMRGEIEKELAREQEREDNGGT